MFDTPTICRVVATQIVLEFSPRNVWGNGIQFWLAYIYFSCGSVQTPTILDVFLEYTFTLGKTP